MASLPDARPAYIIREGDEMSKQMLELAERLASMPAAEAIRGPQDWAVIMNALRCSADSAQPSVHGTDLKNRLLRRARSYQGIELDESRGGTAEAHCRIVKLEGKLAAGGRTEPQASADSVPVNMPFERLPQHAGGFGPVPDVVPLHPSTEPQAACSADLKRAFAAGYWLWFGPANKRELDDGMVEIEKGWAEYFSGMSSAQSQAGSAPQPSSGHGCKRAGGFIDSGCTALCDCHITLALSRPERGQT